MVFIARVTDHVKKNCQLMKSMNAIGLMDLVRSS